ncbi:metal-dependent hydrolase [Paenibacillus sp. GYB003]|uniref:metal-dependent hydrolase n=1 Tax=Paenibacillus sp. GYB003 TaxID=2994392 RepID=UPI002F96E6F6
MDTVSHLFIGLGLGAMACNVPEIGADPALALAVTIGTTLASEAPDIDYFHKLTKGDAVYLKKHRGLTHSVMAWLLWPSVITLGMTPFFDNLAWGWVWLWSFIAVLVHVGLDALNTFGTQALLPFSNKRLSRDVLMVLDPIILFTQVAGAALWWMGVFPPGPLFGILNGCTVLYIAVRFALHRRYVRLLAARYETAKAVSVLPTFRFNRWTAIAETDSELVLGEWKGNRYRETERLLKRSYNDSEQRFEIPDRETLKRISPAADTFFSIAGHIRHERIETDETVRCIWTDLRFRFGNYYPFKAILEFDREGNLVSDFLAWRGNRNRAQRTYGGVEA